MIEIPLPANARGWFSIAVAIILLWMFFQLSLMAWVIGASLVVLVAYVLYVLGYRIHKTAKDRPVRRRGGER